MKKRWLILLCCIGMMSLTACQSDPDLPQKMQRAGMNTLMGMGTVFTVLILISLIISCFQFIPKIQSKLSGRQSAAEKEQLQESRQDVVLQSEPEAVKGQPQEDLELVAVIAAAIAAATGTTTDDFVVRSIKRR